MHQTQGRLLFVPYFGDAGMNAKKILIVDDNSVVLNTLAFKLRTNGYEALTAADAGEAASAVRAGKPALILLDISFPPDVGHGGGVAWDGFLIMDWLRRIDGVKSIPFILITADDPASHMEKALAAGVSALLHKPIHTNELLTAIQHALGAHLEQPQPAVQS